MKHLLLSLLIFGFGISGSLGQTIKSLGYNTTNGQVVANTGTNDLEFTNNVTFSVNRTVSFGGGDVTINNTNGAMQMSGFGSVIDFENKSIVGFNEISATKYLFTLSGSATNGGVYLERIDADDEQTDYDGLGIYDNNGTILASFIQGGISFNAPIAFQNPIVAQTRTNLGLGALWLTNTDVTNFRTDIKVPSYLVDNVTNSVVGGGVSNTIQSSISVVAGGSNNIISNTTSLGSIIGGGAGNTIGQRYGVLVGGEQNFLGRLNTNFSHSFIGGGRFNTNEWPFSVLVGGENNTIGGSNSVVVGGSSNQAASLSFVGGGLGNMAAQEVIPNAPSYSVVVGGLSNAAHKFAFVGGGHNNTNGSEGSVIVGGGFNYTYQVIPGVMYQTIIGGLSNTAFNPYSTVLGGRNNEALLSYSLAAGRRAKITNVGHDGAFVWADSTDADFASTNGNSFNVRANGGMSLDLGTNGITFRSGAAQSRTNLGLGATWLTNSNAVDFRDGIGLGRSNDVIFKGLTLQTIVGDVDYVVMNQVAGSSWIRFSDDDVTRSPFSFSSDALEARARTNLGLQATWLTNTNTANFRTDIGLGTTNNVSFRSLSVRPAPLDPGVILNAPLGGWIDFSDESGTKDIFKFGGEVGQSLARSNLGLGTTNSVQFGNVFITNAIAGSSTNYMLSIGAPDTGFTGVGGPVGAVNFRMGGTALWSASSTGLEFPAGARVRNTLDIQYGGGALGVISFSGADPNTGRAISRTNLGLGGGITATNTFVSYDGTNYTTNVVTISNGIITGWTQ